MLLFSFTYTAENDMSQIKTNITYFHKASLYTLVREKLFLNILSISKTCHQ